MDHIIEYAIPVLLQIALALLALVVGFITIKWIVRRLDRHMERLKVDPTLRPFLTSVADVAMKVLLAITIIKVLGIDTSSLVAAVAAAGLAVGLAFQGSLSNFAGGVLLLFVRPFKVGDYIEANGFGGTVQAIQILYTELVSIDNKVIFLPNGNLANSSIVNYTRKDIRRVDLKFSVGYESNIKQVIEILREVMISHPKTHKEPLPFVRMLEHGESGLIFVARAWSNTSDYWDVYYDIVEEVKERFDAKGIDIPFRQLDVHLKEKR